MTDENLRQNIRAVLQSSKSAVPLNRLQHDFKMLMGHGIPVSELGFSSLDAYLRSIPDVVTITRNFNGELVCEAVSSRQTEHLAQLVKKQRGSKSASYTKGGGQGRARGYRHTSQVRPVKTWSQQPPVHPRLSAKPPLLPTPKNYEVPPRFVRQNSGRTAKSQMTSTTQQMTTFAMARSITPPITPVAQVPPPSTLQNPTFKHSLATFVADRQLGKISYKTTCMENHKQRTKHFISIVKFQNLSFHSYPEEKPTSEEAEEEAARVALEDLEGTYKGINSTELAISRTSCIARRVFEIVKGSPNGMFSDFISTQYVDKFNERLPNNWISLIKEEPILKVERIDELRSIIFPIKQIQNDDIEIHTIRGFSDCSETSSPSPAGSSSSLACQELLSVTVTPLPDENYWNAYVTIAGSTSNLYIRLIGDEYSTKYENLATEMELFYIYSDSATHPALNDINVGDLFAVKNEDCWHRVEVKEILSVDRVKCFYVDHGDSGEFNTAVLWPLEPQFRNLPFQAIKCKLAYLDGLDNFSINMELIECVVGKSLVAYVISRDDMSVVLFDTSTERDLNINKLLCEKVLKGLDSPRLKTGIMDVCLSNLTISGDLFFRVHSPSLSVLEKFIEFAAMECTPVDALLPDKIYLLKMMYEPYYCRAMKIGVSNTAVDQERFLLVDYGNVVNGKLSDVLQLSGSFDVLQRVPHQVLRCRLNGVPSSLTLEWSEKTTERLLNLAPKNMTLIAKLVANTSSEMPLIELFKRLEKTDELVSINQTLDLDETLFSSKNTAGAKVSKSVKKIENLKLGEPVVENSVKKAVISNDSELSVMEELSVSLDSTTPPTSAKRIFPPIGEYIEIIVTLVASPSNFMFCRYEVEDEYENLHAEMMQYYEPKNNLVAPNFKLNGDNEMCAVFHKNKWNRACIKSFVEDDSVSVYFIDSGEYALVSIKDIRPLHEQFRKLTSQAFRGKLAGIEPIHGDWSPEDSCRFKELVDGKPLVALVLSHKGTLDDTRIVMRLCDTSMPNEDVYIHRILIDENRGCVTEAV